MDSVRPPIFRALKLNPRANRVEELVRDLREGELDLDPPYQRGQVWSAEQQLRLIESLTLGLPVPAVVLSLRDVMQPRRCIDGKQRITAARRFLDGDLKIPAWWMPAELVESGAGEQVTFAQFTAAGQRLWRSHAVITVLEAELPGPDAEQREAHLFGLLNSAGSAVTADDLLRASQIAETP